MEAYPPPLWVNFEKHSLFLKLRYFIRATVWVSVKKKAAASTPKMLQVFLVAEYLLKGYLQNKRLFLCLFELFSCRICLRSALSLPGRGEPLLKSALRNSDEDILLLQYCYIPFFFIQRIFQNQYIFLPTSHKHNFQWLFMDEELELLSSCNKTQGTSVTFLHNIVWLFSWNSGHWSISTHQLFTYNIVQINIFFLDLCKS